MYSHKIINYKLKLIAGYNKIINNRYVYSVLSYK